LFATKNGVFQTFALYMRDNQIHKMTMPHRKKATKTPHRHQKWQRKWQ